MSKKKRIAQIENRIREEERNFLIEAYARQLVSSLQENSESPDDKAVESLIVARTRVAPDLAEQIASLLEANGHEVDRETASPEPDSGDGMADLAEAAGDNGNGGDVGGLFEDVELSEEDAEEFFGDEDREILLDDEAEEDGEAEEDHEAGDGLFDADSGEMDEETEYPENVADLGDGEEGLFGDDEPEAAVEASETTGKKGSKKKKRGKEVSSEVAADGGNALADDPDEEMEEVEEDEEAGVLFNQDIYSGHGKKGDEMEEESSGVSPESEDLDLEDEVAGADDEEIPGFTPTEGHEIEETPGFTPTEGHEVEETPGFTPTEGHEVEETPGFTPTDGHEVEETPGFTPTEGHEVEETSGFTPTKGHEVEETPGFTPAEGGKQKKKRANKGRLGKEAAEKEENKRGITPSGAREGKELSAKERSAKAKEELEQRKQQRLAQKQARGKEQQVEEEDEIEDELLEALTYQVSLEDLEKYLGITVVPDDRSGLNKRWKQKLQEPCVKTLLQNAEKSRIEYALIPRLPRFVKDGKANLNSVVTMLRSHPQIFENVPQVIKYKVEPFFVKEIPRLDWAIVSCEALPETRGKNYAQQRVVVKGYAQKHQTTELRVSRRTIVEALFDMVVIQLVIKEKLLINSVELTDSKVGRMNYACINNGDKGIRIGDVSRQQTHPQLGTCASW